MSTPKAPPGGIEAPGHGGSQTPNGKYTRKMVFQKDFLIEKYSEIQRKISAKRILPYRIG